MKIKNTLAIGFIACLNFSCGGDNSETKSDENNDNQEVVEVSDNSENGINIVPSEVNVNLTLDLKRVELPELELSVGLPAGWSSNLGPSFGEMKSYEIIKNGEIMMYIHSKATVTNVNNGEFPQDPKILTDDFDLESTNFFVLDKRTNAANRNIVGIVYQFDEEENNEIRFDYYVQLSDDNYVNVVPETLTQNVDECISIINSIKALD